VQAVETMDRVAIEVERDPLYEAIIHAQRIDPEATGADAISAAARTVAETLNLAAIACYTASGATALRAARERPHQPIVALTPIPATGRKLALVWGQHCVLTDDPRDLDDMVAAASPIRKALRGPTHHHLGGRSARHSGRHQSAAHRLRRRRLRGYVVTARRSFRREPGSGFPVCRIPAFAGMTRASGSLNVLALDLVGQFLDRVARLVEERVRLERFAIGPAHPSSRRQLLA
jgi:hypothetical protein